MFPLRPTENLKTNPGCYPKIKTITYWKLHPLQRWDIIIIQRSSNQSKQNNYHSICKNPAFWTIFKPLWSKFKLYLSLKKLTLQKKL